MVAALVAVPVQIETSLLRYGALAVALREGRGQLLGPGRRTTAVPEA